MTTKTTPQHAVLARLETDLTGVRTLDVVEVGSHKFGFSTLTRAESALARSLVTEVSDNILQAFADSFAPKMAMALASIDGIAVEELWPLPAERPENPRKWRAEQVLTWLRAQPDQFVSMLWERYSDLQDAQRARLATLGKMLEGAEADAGF